MEAIAKTKYLKGSPRKARLVIDLVRGKNVSHALAILQFTNKRAATPIAKCIRSAVANATYAAEQQNIAIDPDDLWIKACFVDMGPTKHRKRLRPAPQGRAYQERRHYCHITVELSSDVPEGKEEEFTPKKRKAKPAEKKEEAKKSEETAAPEEAVEAANEAVETEEAEVKAEAAPEEVKAPEAEAKEDAAEEKADEAPEAEEADEETAETDESGEDEEAADEKDSEDEEGGDDSESAGEAKDDAEEAKE